MVDSVQGVEQMSGLTEVDPIPDEESDPVMLRVSRADPGLSSGEDEDTDGEDEQGNEAEDITEFSEGEESDPGDISDVESEASDISVVDDEDEDEDEDGNQDNNTNDIVLGVGKSSTGFGSESDIETDSEEEEEDRYQKIDQETREAFLDLHHPEAKVQNFEEVKLRANIIRDSKGRITDKGHRTLPFLTKYEMTRILGVRARQIDSGAMPFIEVPPGVLDGYNIAEAELSQRKIPFIIRRPLPGGTSEYWRLKDLELLRAPAELSFRTASTGSR